jgi:hypothetical protein
MVATVMFHLEVLGYMILSDQSGMDTSWESRVQLLLEL